MHQEVLLLVPHHNHEAEERLLVWSTLIVKAWIEKTKIVRDRAFGQRPLDTAIHDALRSIREPFNELSHSILTIRALR